MTRNTIATVRSHNQPLIAIANAGMFSKNLVYVGKKVAEVMFFPNLNHKNCVIQNSSKHFDLEFRTQCSLKLLSS